jgi:methionyl-tRNA formyltransferase
MAMQARIFNVPVTSRLKPVDGFDVGIAYLYPNFIPKEILAHVPILNFHTAPLPDYKGFGGVNFAVLEGLREWGVSCHWMTPELDSGPIVEVRRFPINPNKETALSLDIRSQVRLFELFMDTVNRLLDGQALNGEAKQGGRVITKQDFEIARTSSENTEAKRRAFFYPPYLGATP